MAGPMRRLPRWLDRAGFEADKLMRVNRVRMEASRLGEQADEKTFVLGTKVVEMAGAGAELDPELRQMAEEIIALHADLLRKDEEIKAINAEVWVEEGESPSSVAPPAKGDPIAQRLQSYIESKNNDFNCPKCGTIIRPNKSYCPKCGRKVLR